MFPFDDVIMFREIRRPPIASPHKGPVMRSFDIFFGISFNKQLNKKNLVSYDLRRNDARVKSL